MVFNFFKKLEECGYFVFLKKEDDKWNMYIEIIDKGEELLFCLMEEYDFENNLVFNGVFVFCNFYGKFLENIELIVILCNIYG